MEAVRTASPTPHIHDVVAACHESGRAIAVISNNSASAVCTYLDIHPLAGQISAIAARTEPDPTLLKPSPYLVKQAASALGASHSTCTLVATPKKTFKLHRPQEH
jgi:beta-phosphoglucomutase-like phosphatase (HAD superfamily)